MSKLCDVPLEADSSLRDKFVLIRQEKTWQEAQKYCKTCLGGRLAVLDTCQKHHAARDAVMPSGVVSMLTKVAGSVVKNSSVPLSDMLGKAVGNSDVLMSKRAHIGMKSTPFPPDLHKFRWHCNPDNEGRSTACAHAESDDYNAERVLSNYADQSSLKQKSDSEDWGWNVVDSTLSFGNDLSTRKQAGTGYMLRGMWNDGDEDEERFFVCEFDEFTSLPSPADYSQGEDAWMQICMPDHIEVMTDATLGVADDTTTMVTAPDGVVAKDY